MSQATTPKVSLPGTHFRGVFNIYCPVVDTEVYYTLTHSDPVCAGCGVVVSEERMDEENARPAVVRSSTLVLAQFKKLFFKAPRPGMDYYQY